MVGKPIHVHCTGTPPLTRFFGPEKNRIKGKNRAIVKARPHSVEWPEYCSVQGSGP